MRWVQLNDRLNILWNCLSFGLKWKLTFSSTVAMVEFSKFADILNTALLQAHSIGFLNNSGGIPSPSLALLLVLLLKALLTSCSSISGFMWVTPVSSLSQSLWLFLYSSSVHSCPLFLISSDSVRSLSFLSFIVPNFAWSVPLVSPIFEEIYTFYNSVVCQ